MAWLKDEFPNPIPPLDLRRFNETLQVILDQASEERELTPEDIEDEKSVRRFEEEWDQRRAGDTHSSDIDPGTGRP